MQHVKAALRFALCQFLYFPLLFLFFSVRRLIESKLSTHFSSFFFSYSFLCASSRRSCRLLLSRPPCADGPPLRFLFVVVWLAFLFTWAFACLFFVVWVCVGVCAYRCSPLEATLSSAFSFLLCYTLGPTLAHVSTERERREMRRSTHKNQIQNKGRKNSEIQEENTTRFRLQKCTHTRTRARTVHDEDAEVR